MENRNMYSQLSLEERLKLAKSMGIGMLIGGIPGIPGGISLFNYISEMHNAPMTYVDYLAGGLLGFIGGMMIGGVLGPIGYMFYDITRDTIRNLN